MRRLDVHLLELAVVVRDVLFRQFEHGYAETVRTLDELVIDVRKVLDVADGNSSPIEVAAEHIEYDRVECMADMALGIRSHSTDIETHDAIVRDGWQELAAGVRESVLELHFSSCIGE